MMDDFASDTDSDYTSYWRDWVCTSPLLSCFSRLLDKILRNELCLHLEDSAEVAHDVVYPPAETWAQSVAVMFMLSM